MLKSHPTYHIQCSEIQLAKGTPLAMKECATLFNYDEGVTESCKCCNFMQFYMPIMFNQEFSNGVCSQLSGTLPS